MALTPCQPCNCIPGTIGTDKFKQDVEIILCQILTAIEAGSGGGGNVNLTGINGVAPAVGNGTTNAGTLRVTLSSDSTGSVNVNNGAGAAAVNIQDGGNSITVDGTVAATQSGTWNIGTVATITNPVTVTGSVTVSGTVAATQSGTWNINNVSGTISLPTGAATLAEQQTQTASLSVLDDWDESDRAKVNTIVGQAGVQGGSGTVSANTQRVVLATDVALPAGTNTVGKVDLNPLSSVGSGQTNVTTAGTRVALGASTAIKSVTVKAKSTNTGLIYVGDSSVTSSNGFILSKGEAISADIDNLTDINIDSSVNGEGVSYLYAV